MVSFLQASRLMLQVIIKPILLACNIDLEACKNDIIPCHQSSIGSAVYYLCCNQGLAMPDQMTGTYKVADFKHRV